MLRTLRHEHGTLELETALFWKALNMATLAGNGGWNDWTSEYAMNEAEAALSELKSISMARAALLSESKGRCEFVDAIIHFSRAKVLKKAASPDCEELARIQQEEALNLFLSSFKIWVEEYGEEHPDTIKVGSEETCSLECTNSLSERMCERNVRIRENKHVHTHPHAYFRTLLKNKSLSQHLLCWAIHFGNVHVMASIFAFTIREKRESKVVMRARVLPV